MKRGLRVIVTILGIIIIIYGLFYCLKSNFNIGNLILLFTGVLAAGWFLVPENKLFKRLKALILAGAAVYIMIAGFIFVQGNIGGADFSEDAVIVLGCGVNGTRLSFDLRKRLVKAALYYEENPDCVICVSGGQGPQEDVTEASAMEAYLISEGIPSEKILVEDRASSTSENFRFSKIILDEYFGDEDYKTVYITNDFHSYRSGLIAKSEGFNDVCAYPSKTSCYSIIPNYMREVLAVLKTWVFG